MRNLRKMGAVCANMLLVVCSVQAGDADLEKDPFYSSRHHPGASARPAEGWGTDPFNNPLSGKGFPQQDRNRQERAKALTGILYSKNIRLAVIGGETVAEGGMVGSEKLAVIRKRSVVLVRPEGGSEEIFLDDFSIRK